MHVALSLSEPMKLLFVRHTTLEDEGAEISVEDEGPKHRWMRGPKY